MIAWWRWKRRELAGRCGKSWPAVCRDSLGQQLAEEGVEGGDNLRQRLFGDHLRQQCTMPQLAIHRYLIQRRIARVSDLPSDSSHPVLERHL